MIALKSPRQIEGIRASCRLLSQVLQGLIAAVAVDMTSAELDRMAFRHIRSLGGRPSFLNYNGYPSSICASVDDRVIHGIPDNTRLRNGQIVGIDCGVELNGYFSDAAVTVPVGTISDSAAALLSSARSCLELGIAQMRPGNRIRDISRAIFRKARDDGYRIVEDYCGHGVGLKIHEDPQVPNWAESGYSPRLRPGMVLAIEPMIAVLSGGVRVLEDNWTVVTRDGGLAAHFEHTVAMLPEGAEVLTSW